MITGSFLMMTIMMLITESRKNNVNTTLFRTSTLWLTVNLVKNIMAMILLTMFIMISMSRASTQWPAQAVVKGESRSLRGHNNIQFSSHQGLYISPPSFFYYLVLLQHISTTNTT